MVWIAKFLSSREKSGCLLKLIHFLILLEGHWLFDVILLLGRQEILNVGGFFLFRNVLLLSFLDDLRLTIVILFSVKLRVELV